MVRACEKTKVSQSELLLIIDEIEAQLQLRSDRLVQSSEIGEMVLAYLRNLSEVAYVRFASVYRQFQGVHDFATTLAQLSPQGISAEIVSSPTNNLGDNLGSELVDARVETSGS
jgi:transcriptional repressor NrdR